MEDEEGDRQRVMGKDGIADGLRRADHLAIRAEARLNTPHDIRIATPYFKPNKNKTDLRPDYFVHETDEWLVFPHELKGLTKEEIREHKPWVKDWIERYL